MRTDLTLLTGRGGMKRHTRPHTNTIFIWRSHKQESSMWSSIVERNCSACARLAQRLALILLAAIIPLNALCQVSWEWQNPRPTGAHLLSVAHPDRDTYVAVGWYGTIVVTTDGGTTWSIVRSGTFSHLRSVAFCTPKIGWAAGDHLLQTDDGGWSWRDLGLPGGLISTPDSRHAFVYGSPVSLRTTDAGGSWEEIPTPPPSSFWWTPNCMDFVDSLHGTVVGFPVTRTTTNGGQSWIPVQGDTLEWGALRVSYSRSGVGLMSGNGTLLKSTDRGLSWHLFSGFGLPFANFVSFVNGDTAIAWGPAGSIATSTDAGTSWKTVNGVPQFEDVEGGVGVGVHGTITYSTDLWTTHHEPGSVVQSTLLGVTYCQPDIGLAWGDDMVRTTDAGRSWGGIAGIPIASVTDAAFCDDSTGIAVGTYGGVARSTDAGLTWSLLLERGKDYSAVAITPGNQAIVVGDAGTILRCTDVHSDNIQGSWSFISSGVSVALQGVAMTDDAHGIAVGGAGTVLQTTNGGFTWTRQDAGTSLTLWDVAMIDSLTALTVGDSGVILKTTDGGSHWTRQETEQTSTLYRVRFINPLVGVIAGFPGTVLRTANGGKTWNREQQMTDAYLFGLYVSPNAEVTVAGSSGVILQSSSIPTSVDVLRGFVEDYHLHQNYPNPFNPSTIIRYDISEASHTVLAIYDILGREVSTLVNDGKQPGSYSVRFDGGHLAGGVYFYRLQTKAYIQTRKMLLLK
jgi:photosystem II stability/assembly factor-like uncharacterized protein